MAPSLIEVGGIWFPGLNVWGSVIHARRCAGVLGRVPAA